MYVSFVMVNFPKLTENLIKPYTFPAKGEFRMAEIDTCTSCGIRLVGKGGTIFPCPSCSERTIGRCKQCRNQSAKYVCTECGFRGP